jgi:hypothetical protein
VASCPVPGQRASMAHDRAIMSFDHERRHAAEYDQNPNRKASVPKECVDHECDSFLKELIVGLAETFSRRYLSIQVPRWG